MVKGGKGKETREVNLSLLNSILIGPPPRKPLIGKASFAEEGNFLFSRFGFGEFR